MVKKGVLGSLSPLFNGLNWIALAGWSFVLYKILPCVWTDSDEKASAPVVRSLDEIVLGLEIICSIEVLRILIGDLKGNLILGVVLHGIRFATIFQVLPKLMPGHWTQVYVLTSWAVTEVSRYPMYLLPNIGLFRSIRMVVPLFTFPVGAFCEAYAAYLVLKKEGSDCPWWLSLTLMTILFINGVLGSTMAYPALLKKGLPVLGLTKNKKQDKTPKVKRV